MSDAINKRLLNAADLQCIAVFPELRGENTIFRARKSMSAVDGGFELPKFETNALGGGASTCIDMLTGNMMAYK